MHPGELAGHWRTGLISERDAVAGRDRYRYQIQIEIVDGQPRLMTPPERNYGERGFTGSMWSMLEVLAAMGGNPSTQTGLGSQSWSSENRTLTAEVISKRADQENIVEVVYVQFDSVRRGVLIVSGETFPIRKTSR